MKKNNIFDLKDRYCLRFQWFQEFNAFFGNENNWVIRHLLADMANEFLVLSLQVIDKRIKICRIGWVQCFSTIV